MYWQAIQIKLTCPFHILAYKIEIKHQAAMGDELVHPELKRGHSNWPEASHNVLRKERLHLGLLQANVSNAWKKGAWITDLYKRLQLPVYHGVEEGHGKSTKNKR